LAGRVAGAPISWGVCEVPGWGHQLPVERVLAEMAEVGLTATELGPDGFLPASPAAARQLLDARGLRCLGGFVPVVLHADGPTDGSPADLAIAALREQIAHLREVGADVLVLAADTGQVGYDSRPILDAAGWDRLLARLATAAAVAAEAGLLATLHPHVGTMVESGADVTRVLTGSDIGLCLDTGHLLIGGSDPVALAVEHADRVSHVHLKDVDATMAGRVREGQVGYSDAVAAGLYRPLGAGDIDIAAIVSSLERAGYRGWYVLEQDTVLTGDPEPGVGPMRDVAASLAHLAVLADGRPTTQEAP
jgi:inosose dehydratase